MAGTAAPNKPVFYRSLTEINNRMTELNVNGDQFITGCNRGVANGAIGINTGEYDPKAQDFSREPKLATPASYIGRLDDAVTNMEDALVGLTNAADQLASTVGRVGFDSAASDTAPDATYGSTLTLTNYTGETIPSGAWAWGFEAAGGPVVAPIVDAGGPYTSFFGAGWSSASITGTVTPGSDPSPTTQWVIVSGGTGVFGDPSALSTTFTPTSPTISPMVIALLVTPNDGPPVSDNADVSLVG